jgi:hypothetical protein
MISKHVLRAVHEIGLMAGLSIIWIAKVNAQAIYPPIGTPLPDPCPESGYKLSRAFGIFSPACKAYRVAACLSSGFKLLANF